MSTWTPEAILALAPDSSSSSAGRGLANSSKWVSLGCDERSIWGEAKGSAAKPYETSIDLREIAFKCSCPSRKFPCKHGLGLFLLYAEGACPKGEAPAWTTEWLDKREAKAVKEPKPEKEIDETAQ